jgi:hypothetical protein
VGQRPGNRKGIGLLEHSGAVGASTRWVGVGTRFGKRREAGLRKRLGNGLKERLARRLGEFTSSARELGKGAGRLGKGLKYRLARRLGELTDRLREWLTGRLG